MTVLNIQEVRPDQAVHEVSDATFVGTGKIVFSGSAQFDKALNVGGVPLYTESQKASLASGTEPASVVPLALIVSDPSFRDGFTAAQFSTAVREAATLNPAEDLVAAIKRLRGHFELKGSQQDSFIVDRIMSRLADEVKYDDVTSAQDGLAESILAALTSGKSLGAGREHLDARIKRLSPRVRDRFIEKFLDADTKGEFRRTMNKFQAVVGNFYSGTRQDDSVPVMSAADAPADLGKAQSVAAAFSDTQGFFNPDDQPDDDSDDSSEDSDES